MKKCKKYSACAIKMLRQLLLSFLMVLCLGFSLQAQEAGSNTGSDQSKVGEELDQFVNRFLDWVVLSYATYTGQHDAELESIFAKAKEALDKQPEIQEFLQELKDGATEDEDGDNTSLEQLVRSFTNKTGIGVYFVPQIVNQNDGFYVPIFNNFLAEGAKNPVAPYVIVKPVIDGNHKSGYNVSYSIETSPDLNPKKYNLDQSNSSNPFNAIAGQVDRRASLATQFKPNLAAGVKTLTETVNENFLPKLVIAFEGNVYRPGEEIEVAMETDSTAEIRLVAQNRDGSEPKRAVKWSISPETVERKVRGSDLLFPQTQAGRWAIMAESGSNKATVGVKVVNFNLDWKQIVKTILYEALQSQLEKARAKIDSLEAAGVDNSTELRDQLSKIEEANYPLEPDGSQLYSLYEQPLLLSGEDTIRFYNNKVRADGFRKLRKFKKNLIDVLQQVNMAAFIDILVEDPKRFEELLDNLISDSETLVVEIVAATFDQTERDGKIKKVIIDYLNANLVRLADAEFASQHEAPEIVREALPQAANQEIPTLENENYYINPLVDFPEKEQFIEELEEHLSSLENPPFVVINYSQDLSHSGFRKRAITGRPKGLAEGRDFIVFTLVNIPGSVEMIIESSDQTDPGDGKPKKRLLRVIKTRSDYRTYYDLVGFDVVKNVSNPAAFLQQYAFMAPTGGAFNLPDETTYIGFHKDNGAVYEFDVNNVRYKPVMTNAEHFLGFVEKDWAVANAHGFDLPEKRAEIEQNRIDVSRPSSDEKLFAFAKKKVGNSAYADCYCWYTWAVPDIPEELYGYMKEFSIPEAAEIQSCSGNACEDTEDIIAGIGGLYYQYIMQAHADNGLTFNEGERLELIAAANYLSDQTQDEKTFHFFMDEPAYYDLLSNYGLKAAIRLDEKDLSFFYENKLFKKSDFEPGDEGFFKFQSASRDVDVIWSTVDLTGDIPEKYNENSPDYARSGHFYQYSYADLAKRYELKSKNNPFFQVVVDLEKAGRAEPVCSEDAYDQYVAKWGTNSAVYFIAEWSARWSEDILKAYIAGVGASGIRFSKFLKDAATGATVDFMIQVGIEWAFVAEDDTKFADIIAAVDKTQIAAAAVENAFTEAMLSGNAQLLTSAGASCLFDGAIDDGKLRSEFSMEECAKGAITTVVVGKVAGFAMKKLLSIKPANIRRGFNRINLDKAKWRETLEWLGYKKIDEVIPKWANFDKVSQLVKGIPALEGKLDNWDVDLLKKLDDDLSDSDKLFEKLSAQEGLVDSWRKISKHPNIRKDTDFLEAFKKALDDPELIGEPINIETRIEDWITKSNLKCRTCTGGATPYLDEVLNNLADFKVHIKNNIPGANDVLNQLSSGSRKAKGSNWVMKFTNDKGLNPTKFEEIITDGEKFTADILAGGKYYECKSWSGNLLEKSNFTSQLTNYLHKAEVTNLNQFGFHFNPEGWVPDASKLNNALKANSELFKTDLTSWAKYRQLFGADVDDLIEGDIDGLIDIITSKHFSKIVNPS